MIDVILQNTYTLADLKHRLRILKEYLEGQIFLSPSSLSVDDQTWVNSLPKDFLNQFNKDNLSGLFDRLEKELAKISPLVLYLSFNPDPETVSRLSLWLKNNLTQPYLLEIKLDPGLIGGCALVLQGIYQDYSLRARIQQQKNLILQEFKRYIS